MRKNRPSRIAGAVLAIFSMLFMQLVLAGYVCPQSKGSTAVSGKPAISASMVDMPGCVQIDSGQPNLCHASAHTLDQSLDTHQIPAVQAFVPATISLVLVPTTVPIASNLRKLNTVSQSGAPPPPLAIRHCCFRI